MTSHTCSETITETHEEQHVAAQTGLRNGADAALVTLLLFLVLVAYWPTLGNGFVNWDDNVYISDNPLLRTADGLRRIWLTLDGPQYYPLTFSAYWLQHHLWGQWAAGYHAVSLALHLLDVVLVLALFRRLGLSRSAAWIGAAAFGLHPIQVASVAWTAELKNVLSTAFAVSAMLVYVRWRTGGRGRLYIGSLLFFAAALLSKTATLTLPASLFFYDLLLCRRRGITSAAALVPFGVLSLAAAGVTVLAEGGDPAVDVLAVGHRPLVAASAVVFYLWKLIWPAELLAIYPRWVVHLSWWPGWACLAALGAGLGATIAFRKKICSRILWGIAHFLVSLLPVLGLVVFGYMEKSFVADHFVYLPAIGFFLIAGLAADRLSRGASRGIVVRNVVVAVLLGACGLKTWVQTKTWRSSERLWTHTLAGNPDCWIALNNLGLVHAEREEMDEAIALYRQAIEVNPGYVDALTNLGGALAGQNHLVPAERFLRRALEYQPNNARTRTNLANLLAGQRRFDEAETHYRAAIVADPRYTEARYNAALAFERQGDLSAATEFFQRLLKVDPSYLEGWIGLGRVARSRRELPLAEEAYRKAIALQPADPRAYQHLATVLRWQGRWGEVEKTLRAGLASSGPVPPVPSLQASLASLLSACPEDRIRDGREAIRLATAACTATANSDPASLDALAQGFAEQGDFARARETAGRALQIARQKSYRLLAAELAERIRLYEAGRPFRYPPQER